MGTHSLVVGGTRGIGRCLVRLLLDRGDDVTVISRTIPDLDQRDPAANYISCDVSLKTKVEESFRKLVVDHGRINYLALLHRYRGVEDKWEGEIKTSILGTKNVVDAAVDKFSKKCDKSIAVVSSVAAEFVVDSQPVSYHTVKSGLKGMVRYYAKALGPSGVRVNSVSPCTVLKKESAQYYLHNQSLADIYREITPLGRMGTAKDVAQVVKFLCSEDSSFVTGQDITVDGGISLGYQESLAIHLAELSD